MNRKKILLCCATAITSGLALAAVGCEGEVHTGSAYHDDRPQVVRREVVVQQAPPQREVVIVREPPPAARVEVVPQARPGYVWMPGYYRYNGRQYVWVEGRFERPPRDGNHWRAGHWDRHDNGYIWIEGRWD